MPFICLFIYFLKFLEIDHHKQIKTLNSKDIGYYIDVFFISEMKATKYPNLKLGDPVKIKKRLNVSNDFVRAFQRYRYSFKTLM